jgi:competence protein ComEA
MLIRVFRWSSSLLAWVWAPVVLKMLIAIGAFAALAQVGTSAAAHLPAGRTMLSSKIPTAVAGAVARAAPAVAPSVEASAATSARPCGKDGAWTADGRLRINVATRKDFERLPGIGAKRADAIVTLRERIGRFRRARDLMRVRGIGPRSIKKLTPLIVVDAVR